MGKIIFVVILILYSFYIYEGETPETKIYRACAPITTVTGVLQDAASRWHGQSAEKLQTIGDNSSSWCQYVLYRTLYGTPQGNSTSPRSN